MVNVLSMQIKYKYRVIKISHFNKNEVSIINVCYVISIIFVTRNCDHSVYTHVGTRKGYRNHNTFVEFHFHLSFSRRRRCVRNIRTYLYYILRRRRHPF